MSMRSLLICHHDDIIDREGVARWMASFSHLAGIVVIEERPDRARQRIRRELQRVGPVRFLDVLAFRLYYRMVLAARDAVWKDVVRANLVNRFPAVPASTPVFETHSPNDAACEAFIRACAPDIVIARCKFLLKESVFTIPRSGTFVLHPGICPEYRNAHGCFWALAQRDLERVGVTLLQIDRGVDTGPVYGYYSYPYDEVHESHIVIQYRCVLDNLDAIAAKLRDVHAGTAARIDTAGRRSGAWGQPWLTRWVRWKRAARRTGRERNAEGIARGEEREP
jgi:folate-dependent phosphoribosylglycinamide formyltransferase PurN